MSSNFSTTTHAKWILAGEHAVLRKHPALVYPVLSKTLSLEFHNNHQPIHAEFAGECGEDIHLLFWSVLERGLALVEHSLSTLQGNFIISSNIPIGAGMGASAALCAALARWFSWQQYISHDQIYAFARELEHLFHGQSSGVDIAGALASHGCQFQQGNIIPIEQAWQPIWYLSFSGQIGITSHCVKKVQALWQKNPARAAQIDQTMASSVTSAIEAFKIPQKQGLAMLAAAINKARTCFAQWGLASGHVDQHIQQLLSAGAIAAKPTGSGDGGYVLSLWDSEPNHDIEFELITL